MFVDKFERGASVVTKRGHRNMGHYWRIVRVHERHPVDPYVMGWPQGTERMPCGLGDDQLATSHTVCN